MKKKTVSIVIPCFNEEENINQAYAALRNVTHTLKQYIFEFIFVDNGSTDNSRVLIHALTQKNAHVKGVSLHRFGVPDSFKHVSGSREYLLDQSGLSSEELVSVIKKTLLK